MIKFINLVFGIIFCVTLAFNPSIVMASNSTTSMGTNNNNTNAVATLKEPNTASKLNVVASFYPTLEFVKNVGGDRVEV
jgi:ABC-type Zn uptake system ZnuABC Zn-binding protein ZnuA